VQITVGALSTTLSPTKRRSSPELVGSALGLSRLDRNRSSGGRSGDRSLSGGGRIARRPAGCRGKTFVIWNVRARMLLSSESSRTRLRGSLRATVPLKYPLFGGIPD
jgi:hypothetical protein